MSFLPIVNLSMNAIHTEVGGSSGTTVSLNDADVRGIGYTNNIYDSDGINQGSGTAISMSEFRDANRLDIDWSPYINSGNFQISSPAYLYWGYARFLGGGFGTTNDLGCDLFSNAPWEFWKITGHASVYGGIQNDTFKLYGPFSNSGWEVLKLYSGTSNAGTFLGEYRRANATYSATSGTTQWIMDKVLLPNTTGVNYFLEFFSE
tara:strand:- start:325 stop:939 length:615 start_codon:yes stop_codon:yes gene_type:complete